MAEVITVSLDDRQSAAVRVVCEKLKTTPDALLRKLIDIRVEPLAIKYGLPNILAGAGRVSSSKLHFHMPRGFHHLTTSQLEAMLDAYRQGWRADDLSAFYGIKTDDIDTFFAGKTNSFILRLIKEIRTLTGQERQQWRPLGDH